jgi:hypothetical protein
MTIYNSMISYVIHSDSGDTVKHIPSCMNTADIEHLLQDIPLQQPVVVPAKTVQEGVVAGE